MQKQKANSKKNEELIVQIDSESSYDPANVKEPPEIDGELKLTAKDPNKKKKKFKMLSAFSILFIIIAVLVFISWILQWSGVQATWDHAQPVTDDATGITTITPDVRPGTIHAMGIVDVFYSVFAGFKSKADIIVFILSLGAFITIVVNSKALEGFAQSITSALKGKEVYAIIPLMVFFSICGTVEGMAEESLGFYMICIPLLMAAGFDKFTGLMVVLVGAGTGVLASTVNPFVVTIAVDGLNGAAPTKDFISVGDGLVWRLVSWLIMTAISIIFVMWYAMRTKKNPQKSIVFNTMEGDKKFFLGESTEKIQMDWRKKLTLAMFGIVFLIMIMYLIGWDSILGYKPGTGPFEKAGNAVNGDAPYITALIPGFGIGGLLEVASFFLIGSIIIGLVNGLGEEGFLSQFMAGASDILSVCLIIATAAGVGVILENSHMQELFVKGLADSVGGIQPIGRVIVLFIVFLPLSFVIPSSSGFAAAVFPLLAGTVAAKGDPSTADAIAASGSIQAYSFANGLLNMFTPTSGVVMGAVAIARMDYGKFLKGMAPILGILAATSVVLLAVGGAIGGTIA